MFRTPAARSRSAGCSMSLLPRATTIAERRRPAGRLALLPAALLLLSLPTGAQSPVPPEREDFSAFVSQVRADALARGVRAATVDRALSGLEPSPTVIERDRSQAEMVLSIDQYVARRLTKTLVRTAGTMATRHKALLARVTSEYGVPPRIVIAVWGMESNFG